MLCFFNFSYYNYEKDGVLQMSVSQLAGKKAPKEILVNVADLVSSYYTLKPDLSNITNKVAFGTSGHRGNAFSGSFNENHILAITQAVAEYRKGKVKNQLFIGMDTHASQPLLKKLH